MKALVTGGGGFIGSHLVGKLLSKGDEVTVLDNFSTSSLKNLETYRNSTGFKLINGSILDFKLAVKLLEENEVCFHLAAALGVKRIVDTPIESLEINLHGTEIIVREAARLNKRLFLAITSEIYGKNPMQPLDENSDRVLGSPHIARWSYSESKAIDEFLISNYGKTHQLQYIIGRFFNTVGPRQTGSYGMVLPRFVESALSNKPLFVYGDGSQQRVFCHVRDAVEAVAALMDTPNAYGEVFNIGGVEEISILALAQKVILELGSESEIVLIPFDEAYPSGFEETFRRVPNINKIKKFTGWFPGLSLSDIIEDTARSLRF